LLYLLIIGVLNLALTLLPLTNILSYESSAINGILFSLISGIYWLQKKKSEPVLKQIYFLFFLIFIPLIILSISTIICQSCPLGDGLLFYLIISLPSILIGIAISKFSEIISQKYRYLIFVIIWVIVLLGFLPELYFNPQIYFYNPIFGYYPGVIYDQNIEITWNLIFYRLINTIISVSTIYLSSLIINFKKSTQLIVIIVVSILYLNSFFIKSQFNFSTDLNTISSELKGKIETKNFTIIFPDSLSGRERRLLKIEHEFSYSAISDSLQTKTEKKITSVIFGAGSQKKRLFGSANADVAKPWLNQIYLNVERYKRNLKHEISHIFSANYGSGLFKIPSNYNPGLIEGFAVSIENNYDTYDIHYLASLAHYFDYRVSLKQLFGNLSFFSNASSISYIYAGSFLKYLSETYSWDEVKQVYGGMEFSKIFNNTLENLEQDYYTFLKNIEIEKNIHAANYYFGRRPLIKKYCARATAKDLKTANKLLKEKKNIDAANKYLEIYEYSGTYSALVGYARASKELDDINGPIEFLTNELEKFEGTSSYYYLEFVLGDLYALKGDYSKSTIYYNLLIEQNPHRAYLRNAKVNNEILTMNDSIKNIYLKQPKSRKEIILDICKTKPTDMNIQHTINLLDINDDEYEKIISIINQLILNKFYSSETYFLLSKFAYNYLDFNSSRKFALLALSKSDYKRESVIAEHISKLEWIERNKY